jgi:hypothetical protein
MVLLVLAALVIVAVPFVRQMRLMERSARGFEAERRAEQLVRAGRELGVTWLLRSHPDSERRAALRAFQLGDSGEDWDDLAELTPRIDDLDGAETLSVSDQRGSMISVRVEDEQGKLHLNGASSLALMNLLGVWVLEAGIDEDAQELVLEDTDGLFIDGDPETVDGLLRIGGELIAYRDVQGSRVLGLERGVMLSALRPEDLRHQAGALVHDARGWKLALHPFWVEPGAYRPFETVTAAREIALWRLALPYWVGLFWRGYTTDDLRMLGFGAEALAALGIDGDQADARVPPPPDGEGDIDAAASRLARSPRPERAAGLVGRAMRGMGREGGRRYAETLARRLGGDEATRALAEAMQEHLKVQQAHEERYFAAQAAQARVLSEAHDIEVLGARELERLRPHVTVWSTRPIEWAGGALILNHLLPRADRARLGAAAGAGARERGAARGARGVPHRPQPAGGRRQRGDPGRGAGGGGADRRDAAP